ncbi:conjugal transfer protein [Oceanobacillus oncorhynchi]|uniref:conjugal transfer protein n=1 Tax=Oceanobacillus oncorhynchi TaxID=545501 RepID=UPI0018667F70|nr:conjugal transfer protein [Oceanobacillus oncorhynchi]
MKKNKFSTKIKNIFTFLKRATKTKKPKQKEKVRKPRAYIFRKLGAVTFWSLFGFMFLVVLVNIVSSSNSNANADEEIVFEINSTTQPAAIEFAKDYAKEYFTWVNDDLEDRELRVQPYLATGIDVGNLDLAGMGWNATLVGSALEEVNEISSNKSHIILSVNVKLTRVVTTGQGKNAKEEEETENLEKYFAVPVATDGESYGVYNKPYFTNVDKEVTVANTGVDKHLDGIDSEYAEEETNIKNFLPTFYESYAMDTQDKLSYVLDDPDVVGLEETMNFVEVKSTEVYQGRYANEFIVANTVTFEEPTSQLTFDNDFLILVEKSSNRYIVKTLNAEPIVEEMTGYTVETESDIDEQDLEQLENQEESEKEESDSESSGENEMNN